MTCGGGAPIMRKLMLLAGFWVCLGTVPAAKADNSDVVAGAVVLLGAAAIYNRLNNDDDGPGRLSPDERSEFQRGYRDGLRYEIFDVDGATDLYLEGYRTGISERNDGVDDHRQHDQFRLPAEFHRACRVRGAEAFGTTVSEVRVVGSEVTSPVVIRIEVRHDRRYGHCRMNRRGEVLRFATGRL
jgi:hypothetical protein